MSKEQTEAMTATCWGGPLCGETVTLHPAAAQVVAMGKQYTFRVPTPSGGQHVYRLCIVPGVKESRWQLRYGTTP
jgi:hypothetical protein